jgi:hypothetical protein
MTARYKGPEFCIGLGIGTIYTWKIDKRLETRSDRSLWSSDSPKALSREFLKYMLDIVGVDNGRFEKGYHELGEEYDFSVDGRTEIIIYLRDVCCISLSCELLREKYFS